MPDYTQTAPQSSTVDCPVDTGVWHGPATVRLTKAGLPYKSPGRNKASRETSKRYRAALNEAAASLGVAVVKLGRRSVSDEKLLAEAHRLARKASGLWGGKRKGSGRKRLPEGKKAVFAFGRVDSELGRQLMELPRRTRSAYLREAAALLFDILPPSKWAEKYLASGEKKIQNPDR